MLEDDYAYVIHKALIGADLAEEKLVEQLGLTDSAWQSFLAGDFDVELAQKVAEILKLKPDAFTAYPIYHPKPVEVEGVTRIELPFKDWGVNAWWIEKDDTAIVFDTGTGPNDLVEAMPKTPDEVFITHGHHDHVGGVEVLQEKGVIIHRPESLESGQELCCGSLRLVTCDLSGHYTPSLGYHVDGLERPVLVVGDALYAGSMGKTSDPERYQQQLDTLKAAMNGLPDNTVLLPGHGPATTVGEEQERNPFL